MKSLQQIKNEVAQSYGYTWDEILDDDLLTDKIVTDVAKRCAKEAIDDIDTELAGTEDWLHGEAGEAITNIRGEIINIINELK